MLGFEIGMSAQAPLSPVQWDATFSAEAQLCSGSRLARNGALLRRWRDTAPRMEQPALTHHYLALHTGGSKKVTRYAGRSVIDADVKPGTITLAPAGASYIWITEGPIGFVHLYLMPATVDHVISEEFDRDARHVEMIDNIGRRLPLLGALLNGMTDQVENPGFEARLVLDTLLHHIVVQLVAECSNLPSETDRTRSRHSIAPRRLARVLDFIESHLNADIGLAELASIAGSSRYHFSRAFRDATGSPPYRYLITRRIEAAKRMLVQQDAISIEEIAKLCGFNSRRQFEVMFRRYCDASPGRYRRER